MTKDIKEPVEWSSGKTSDWAQVVIDDHICIVNIDISYKGRSSVKKTVKKGDIVH